jgi:hypothetical protein
MNLDEKIKAELESEANDIDKILLDDQGLIAMAKGSFKSGMGPWMIVVNIVILLVTAVMLWTGYLFFTANSLEGQTFWGVCLLLSAYSQIAMKQWVWLEMSRSSLMREIKRVELTVARLSSKLSNT